MEASNQRVMEALNLISHGSSLPKGCESTAPDIMEALNQKVVKALNLISHGSSVPEGHGSTVPYRQWKHWII